MEALRATGALLFFPKGALTHHLVVAKSAFLRFCQTAKTADAPLLLLSPQSLRLCGGPFWAVVSLPLVGLVRSSRSAFQPLLQRGQAMPQADIACAVGCHVFPEHQNSCETTSQLPAKTCHRQLCRRYGYRFSGDTHFLFAKKKQKRREGENEWQSTIWKQK